MQIKRRPLCLALASLWLAGSAIADEESIYFSDFPIVASVTRLPQPLSEAPGAVTVIDREMIRASGARNFADLLRLVPGFQVTPPSQDSALVAYHGLSNEEYTPRVQVLIDGRSQYSPLFKSGVNWNLLPVVLENIERIEVMRGSNTVSYGSNAFLGVINIITQDASQTQGWMVSANHGNTASVRDETIRWGGKSGAVDIRMTYHQMGDDGLSKMTTDNWAHRFDPHDSRHSSVFDLRIDAPLTDRDELQITLSNATDRSQYGRPGNLADPFRDYSQNSAAFSAEWHRALGAGDEFKLRYSHVQDWASGAYLENVKYTDVDGNDHRFDFRNQTGGESVTDELEFQHILSLSPKTRGIWGVGTKYSSLYSPYQLSTTSWKDRSSYRAFGNLEWRPAQEWLINLGSSLEYDTIAEWMFDPRASVSYHVVPGHTLRFVASRAHRSPSIYEAYGETRKSSISGASNPVDITYLAAPGLQPEQIDTLELGYLAELKPLRATFDLRAFHERVPNRIQIVPYALPGSNPDDSDKGTTRRGEDVPVNSIFPNGRADAALNLENVVIEGYEYQARWQPYETTRLIYGHAYTRISANLDASVIAEATGPLTDKISRQTRESAPLNSQSAMVMQRLPYGFDASVMYYKSSRVSWKRNSYTNPYERVDWRLAKSFRLGSTNVEVAYTAQMANHDMDARLYTRIANEVHWLSFRADF